MRFALYSSLLIKQNHICHWLEHELIHLTKSYNIYISRCSLFSFFSEHQHSWVGDSPLYISSWNRNPGPKGTKQKTEPDIHGPLAARHSLFHCDHIFKYFRGHLFVIGSIFIFVSTSLPLRAVYSDNSR